MALFCVGFFVNDALKVVGSTMTEAMATLKKELGDDALILSTEHHAGQYILYAKPSILGKESKGPLYCDMKDFYPDPMCAIKAVCDLCDQHQLGYAFCEAWLHELSHDFISAPIGITRSLAAIVPFSPYWLQEVSPHEPLIFVGPPGSGKTVSLAKLAAMLLGQKKRVRVLTLDTLKAGAVSQLKAYMDCMDQPLLVGDSCLDDSLNQGADPKNDEYLLIDTPGINILSSDDQNFLYQLSKRTHTPLTLTLAADMNPIDAERVARNFYVLNTRRLIATRFDATQHYGGVLSASYACGLPIAAYGKSPALTSGLHSLQASDMLEFLL